MNGLGTDDGEGPGTGWLGLADVRRPSSELVGLADDGKIGWAVGGWVDSWIYE